MGKLSRRSARSSWIGAGPPPWRAERARGAARWTQRRSKKSARTSECVFCVLSPPRPPPAPSSSSSSDD
eukprot:1726469-Pyramimonas_sp.AAC.1